MAKSKKDLAMELSGQGSFLDRIQREDPGLLNISLRFRAALSLALRKCLDSRYQVAAKMSEMAEADISKTMVDAYTADSKEYHRFPAEWMPAFVRATGSTEPLIILVQASGYQLITREEEVYVEFARLERQEEEIRKKKEILKRHMGR